MRISGTAMAGRYYDEVAVLNTACAQEASALLRAVGHASGR